MRNQGLELSRVQNELTVENLHEAVKRERVRERQKLIWLKGEEVSPHTNAGWLLHIGGRGRQGAKRNRKTQAHNTHNTNIRKRGEEFIKERSDIIKILLENGNQQQITKRMFFYFFTDCSNWEHSQFDVLLLRQGFLQRG